MKLPKVRENATVALYATVFADKSMGVDWNSLLGRPGQTPEGRVRALTCHDGLLNLKVELAFQPKVGPARHSN
jgi:hypothetical protein